MRPLSELSSKYLTDPKAMKRLAKQEKENKERDARMKYGKRYKEVLKKQKEAKDKLHHETRTKGVRFYDKKGSGYMKGGVKKYD
jgi:hypothetical protein